MRDPVQWSFADVCLDYSAAVDAVHTLHSGPPTGPVPRQVFPPCMENPIYVFLIWELRGLSPNFHIYVSVSDLYIPRICPHISLKQNRQTDPGNI